MWRLDCTPKLACAHEELQRKVLTFERQLPVMGSIPFWNGFGTELETLTPQENIPLQCCLARHISASKGPGDCRCKIMIRHIIHSSPLFAQYGIFAYS
jgi:hypothetical protein